jgi:hypothetical protein
MKHLRSPSIGLLSGCDRLFGRLFGRPSIAFDHPYFYPPITLGGSKPRFRPWAAERGSARRESEEAKLRPSRSFSGDSPMTSARQRANLAQERSTSALDLSGDHRADGGAASPATCMELATTTCGPDQGPQSELPHCCRAISVARWRLSRALKVIVAMFDLERHGMGCKEGPLSDCFYYAKGSPTIPDGNG